jgi:hypothetical protein
VYRPSAAELAQGDPTAEAEATGNLRAEIARLNGELAKLQGQQAAPPLDPAAGEPPPAAPKGKKTEAKDGGESGKAGEG